MSLLFTQLNTHQMLIAVYKYEKPRQIHTKLYRADQLISSTARSVALRIPTTAKSVVEYVFLTIKVSQLYTCRPSTNFPGPNPRTVPNFMSTNINGVRTINQQVDIISVARIYIYRSQSSIRHCAHSARSNHTQIQ